MSSRSGYRTTSSAAHSDALQTVVNAAARLTVAAQRYDRITLLLAELHWLWKPQRTQYKLCVQGPAPI